MALKLTWVHVVVVASIGTVLEWWDFYSYAQLDKTLTTVFFGSGASETGYWLIFGLSMAARPLGALLYGHIGDVYGRSRALAFGIMGMAVGTVGIGVLPTYDTGSYTAGAAATVLMGLFKCIQGLALGGEFGAATVYISEMASVERRAFMTSILQSTSSIGLLLAVSLVMVLQATVSAEDMLIWGWRIPFLLAFTTALLGWWMRTGMPEPHAFLEAARKEKLAACRTFSKRQVSLARKWQVVDEEAADVAIGSGASDKADHQQEGGKLGDGSLGGSQHFEAVGEGLAGSGSEGGEEPFEKAVLAERSTSLSRLHDNASQSKTPMIRVLRDNWVGVCIQIMYTAWLTCSSWCVTSWMPSQLRNAGMDTRVSQGILLVAVVPNLLACYATGWALDKGAPAVRANMLIITVGTGVAFGTSYGAFHSTLAAWLLIPLLFTFTGAAFPVIGLPATRIYAPLERITGFSFAYACSTGLLGGFTPNISNGLMGVLGPSLEIYAGAFWLLIIWAATMTGCLLLRKYVPRIDKPFVGHIE